MKKSFFVGICFLCLYVTTAFSQPVSESIAKKVAVNFISSQNRSIMPLETICEVTSIGRGSEPAMYAVSVDSDWVLVSADERIEPILAYSTNHQGRFPLSEEMPPAMRELLDWYEQMISSVNSGEDTDVNPQWAKYKNELIELIEPTRSVVEPFLQHNGNFVAWGQSGNDSASPNSSKTYNMLCPSGDNCNHTLVGCVAVAMAQVMWYWRWPLYAVVKNDNNQYVFRDYNWSNSPCRLNNNSTIWEAIEVATLLHDAGTSVSMAYGCEGSSAYTSSIAPALRNTFGFEAANAKYRDSYTDSEWIALLKADLDVRRPIIYRGTLINEDEGHAFIIHGYDSDSKFYINFGWGGKGEGYFSLNNIPYGADCFCRNQAAITGIHKQWSSCDPITIQPTTSWPTGFTCINGGGITIGNRQVLSVQTGRIYSNEYIRLTEGFRVHAGANVHIATKFVPCSQFHQLTMADSDSSITSSSSKVPTAIGKVYQEMYSVSPNPATDYIVISCSEQIDCTSIYNLNGKAVLQTVETEINVSALPAGIYIVRSETTHGEVHQAKIILL